MKTAKRARDKYHWHLHLETIRQNYRHQRDVKKTLLLIGVEDTLQARAAFCSWCRSKGISTTTKFYWGDHPEEAIALYQSGLSLKDCVLLFGERERDNEHFRRWLHKRGIPLRGVGLRGEKHNSWRGGVKLSKGYRMVQHPNGSLDKNNRRVYILEHRLVMELHLGRPLARNEVVHHKNNDILDNRIENLELYTTNADHLRDTLKGQVPNWTPEGKARISGRPRKRATGLLQQDLL